MNWYIGQPIVAVVNHSQGKFKKGDEFTIKSLRGSFCGCKKVLIDIGLPQFGASRCPFCENLALHNTGASWIVDTSFAPLDQDISELTEILEQSNPFQNV